MKKNNHNKCVQNETTERVAIIPIPIGSSFPRAEVGLYFIHYTEKILVVLLWCIAIILVLTPVCSYSNLSFYMVLPIIESAFEKCLGSYMLHHFNHQDGFASSFDFKIKKMD